MTRFLDRCRDELIAWVVAIMSLAAYGVTAVIVGGLFLFALGQL